MRTFWRSGEREVAVELARDGADRFRLRVGGVEWSVTAEVLDDGALRLRTPQGERVAVVTAQGGRRYVHLAGEDWVVERLEAGRRGAGGADDALVAPMPGIVVKVHVRPGDVVEQGAALITVEAMKMEHVIRAPRAGTVGALACEVGQMVEPGVPLVEVAAGEAGAEE
jgi:biotin carboxyl carrier protein